MGEVLTVLPFQNTIATFQISGKDIVAALENGVSQLEEGAGRFAQVAGLKYSFDKSAAPESRVKSVEVMDNGNWVPIDPNKDYLVASNNYVRQGGDGYKVFADNAKNAYDYGPGLEQVVADYLGAHKPYTPKLEGRITEVAAGQPAAPAEEAAKPTDPAAETMPDLPSASSDLATTPPPVATEAAPATPAAGTGAETSHVIVAGDTLWDLAVKAYGDGAKWRAIADANSAYRPRRLPIGATLQIPAAN
jgi:5'-nucleotidase